MNGVPDNPELLLRERAWLHALARQLVRPHEGASELAHDALTAAMTQSSPRTAGLRGWLAAILKNQLAGRRRAEHRRRARETMAARTEAVPATLDTVARFEVQRDVGNAVLALAEPYRTTVLLRFWEELSPAAISERMDVPVETVRTRLRRGLVQLRERLDAAHGGERKAWVVPLWVSLRPASAAAAPFFLFAGVSLMAAWTKVVAGAIAVAAAVWLMMTPWSPSGDAAPPAATTGSANAAAATGELSIVAGEAETHRDPARVERAVPDPTDAAWLVVTGTVVDDADGKPLRDVPVRLVCWPATGVDVEAATAADGTFVLHDARPPGRQVWQVVVLAPDYAAVHVDPFAAKGPRHEADAGTIRLVRGTMFSGQVVDQDGQPVAGAELLLPLLAIGYSGYGPQNMLQRAACLGHADGTGRFRLEQPLAPGMNHRNLLFAVAARGIGWCKFEPSKQRREVADLVIALRPSGSARVLVEDPTGRPFAGALVRALPRFGPLGIARGGWRAEVSALESTRAHFVGRTDANGELLLQHLPIGERDAIWRELEGTSERAYELWVDAEGHPEQSLHSFELQPAAEQRITVRLAGPREVALSVDVRDDLGAPILGALVRAGVQVEGRTDAAGHIELAVAASPQLSVLATSPGHRQAHSEHDLGAGPTSLQVALVLARTQTLDGRVVDQTGAPVAGMSVVVGNHTDSRIVGTTDADGRFHAKDFPMGLQRIGVAMGVGMDGSQWIGKQDPEQVDAAHGPVTIVMQRRLGSVDVRVAIVDAATGEALEPIEAHLGLYLELEATKGFFVRKWTQTERGFVVAKGAPAGRWQLSVRTATGQRGSLEFALTEGQPPTDLRLELAAPGGITGRLQFVGVTPPAQVTLHVRHATVDRASFVQYRYPGRWQFDAASQTVVDAQHGGTGGLRLQPASNSTFRLDSADATDDLVFTVRGEGITGQATVRVAPGQTRELVIEVTAKAK